MGCATTTVKIVSIIFNLLLGIISIGGIIWISLNPNYLGKELLIGCYVTLALCIVFAFIGIFATIRESVCLTATCAVFLLALTLISIAIALLSINNNKHNGVEAVNKAWGTSNMDEMQTHLKCCGKTSSNDYVLMNKPIPTSCYANKDSDDVLNLFIEGCSEKMINLYKRELYYFSILSWICVAFEFFGFLLTVFLVINFRNTQRRMQF